jgi:hypothetical protein
MRTDPTTNVEPYLARVRGLPFAAHAEIRLSEAQRGVARADTILVIATVDGRRHEFLLEVKRTNLTHQVADDLVARAKEMTREPVDEPLARAQQLGKTRGWILFAPYVPRKIGAYLAEKDVNFVDLAGNHRVRIGDRYLAAVEGRRPERRTPEGRGLRAAGHQVLFAILARPALLNETIEKLAELAGVGKTAVADTIAKLVDEGLVAGPRRRRRLLAPVAVLDRWLAGYANVVRGPLLVGRYRTKDLNPAALEARLIRELQGRGNWGFGGTAGAYRVDPHYRGTETTVHLAAPREDLPARLQAITARDGPLVLMKNPGRIAFEGVAPLTVHPLLIYTELLAVGDDRAREAAAGIRERYLGYLR